MSITIDGTTGISKVQDGIIDDKKFTSGAFSSAFMGHNYVIDGAFDIWHQSTVQTTNGYGSDTMWLNQNVGSTKTHTRQLFAVGETFPDGTNCPRSYSRTVVSSVVGAANNVIKQQRIEYVSTLAGKKAILSFYAKADTSKYINVEFLQYFGTGGTPSASVDTIGSQKILLSTVWTKYKAVINIPSILGKTIGTSNDDWLQLNFWFDAGSNFNSRTNTLGQQSGTFDLALVKLEEGEIATPYLRDVGPELTRTTRYFEILSISMYNNEAGAQTMGSSFPYIWKRVVPTVTYVSGTAIVVELKEVNWMKCYSSAPVASATWLTTSFYIDARL